MDIEALVHKEIDAVILGDWTKCEEHWIKIQERDFIKAGLRYTMLKSIILTINPNESNQNEDEDENED